MWFFSILKAIAFFEHLYNRYVPCSPFFLWGSYPYISGLNVVWPQRRRDIEAKHWPQCRDVEANDMIWYDIFVIRLWGQVSLTNKLTNKKITTNTKTNRKTMTMTNTFKEHLQRAIFETFGLWDIWSERWENMTWPTKRQQQRRRQIQWRWQIDLENTPNEGFLETFWEHPRMAIQEKFWVWPIIHCYEFSQTLPDQTDGGWPNFTISAKFHNPGILGIPGVRAASQFLRCLCSKPKFWKTENDMIWLW